MATVITVLQNIATALFGTGGAIPTFWTWLTGETVLPYFLIGVGISVLLLGIKIVKGIFWGV